MLNVTYFTLCTLCKEKKKGRRDKIVESEDLPTID